jgi:hypothetical protein
MTDPTHNPPKKLSGLMAGRTFTVEKDKYVVGSYEHYVHLTSKLIKLSYIATHKLVQDWPLDKITRRYDECTKHAGPPPEGKTVADWQAMLWWSKRKKDKETPK